MGNSHAKTILEGDDDDLVPTASDTKGGVQPEPMGGTIVASGNMLKHQQALLSLPVPDDLGSTMDKFLETVYPFLLNDEKYEDTKQAVEAFKKEQGPELLEKVRQYAKTHTNYLETLLQERELTTNLGIGGSRNPFFILEDDPTPSRNEHLVRATSLTMSLLKLVYEIRNETLSADRVDSNNERSPPLCMSQYKRLFGTARIPHEDHDDLHTFAQSRHMVVIRRNQFYYFDVVDDDGTTLITEAEMSANFKTIVENADMPDDSEIQNVSMGACTTDSRQKWAHIRELIIEASPTNRDSMEVIDSAIFILCLDSCSPQTIDHALINASHGLHFRDENGNEVGTCLSRCYDKFQLIVAENGSAACNFEKSSVDPKVVLRILSDIVTDTVIQFAQSISGKVKVRSHVKSHRLPLAGNRPKHFDASVRKLVFDLGGNAIAEGIRASQQSLFRWIEGVDSCALEYDEYGKSIIQGSQLDPDSFCQLGIICAFYNIAGYFPNAKETVSARQFLHGRTELARTSTIQARDWCRAFNDSTISDTEKIEILRAAVRENARRVTMAENGEGVDNILFAMKIVSERDGEDLPAIFTSDGYQKLGRSELESMNCSNTSLRLFGFSPSHEKGVSVGYNIKDDSLSFTISSSVLDTRKYREELRLYFRQVLYLLMALHDKEFQQVSTKSNGKVPEENDGGSDAKKKKRDKPSPRVGVEID